MRLARLWRQHLQALCLASNSDICNKKINFSTHILYKIVVSGIQLESRAREDRKMQWRHKMCRDRGSNLGLRNYPPAPQPPDHRNTMTAPQSFWRISGFLLQLCHSNHFKNIFAQKRPVKLIFWAILLCSHMPHDLTHTIWSGTRVQAFRSTACCPWQRAPYHVYFPLPMAAGSITFLSARLAHECMAERRKRRRTNRGLKLGEKLCSKGKSCTKTNSCDPKVTVTDGSSEEGLKRPVWSTGGPRSFAVFEQSKGEFSVTVHTIRRKRHASACKTGRSRQVQHGDIRQQVLRIDKDIDSGRIPSTTVHGCLAGRRPLCGHTKKTCHRLARQNGEAGKTFRFDYLRFLVVHQMIISTFKSVSNASCRGMWDQQSKRSAVWDGPGCI